MKLSFAAAFLSFILSPVCGTPTSTPVSTPDPKTKVGMDGVTQAMFGLQPPTPCGKGASTAVGGSHKNDTRNDDGNFTDSSTPDKSDANDTSYVQNDLPYFNGNKGSPGFKHDDSVIAKVTRIFQSITQEDAYKRRSNHILGMIDRLPLNDINEDIIRKILEWFPPHEITPIVAEGFDVCTRTANDIAQLVAGSEEVHINTIDTEGTTYEKDVTAKVSTWKSVDVTMQANTANYLVDSVEMVSKAVKKINDLGLGDGDWYTGSYIGEASTQTTAGRDEDRYPDSLYEVARALGVDVQVRKVSDVTPFNVRQSLFQEAFHATLLQQATTLTRQGNHRGGECRLLLWNGEGFNSVRAGERDHKEFSSGGYSLLDFFYRNYNRNGKISVIDIEGNVCDGFENAICISPDQRSIVIGFFKDHESRIRRYIVDDYLRGKTKKDVIKNQNVDLTIEYGFQYFGYIVGKKNYELGRGFFNPNWAIEILKRHPYVTDRHGKAPTADTAFALCTELRVFNKHRPTIIDLSEDKKTKNWQDVNGEDVFCIGHDTGGKQLYDYIKSLVKFVGTKDGTKDWRVNMDVIKKLRLDKWEDARRARDGAKAATTIQARKQSFARPTNIQMVDNNGMDHDGVATAGLEALKRSRASRDEKKNDDKKKKQK